MFFCNSVDETVTVKSYVLLMYFEVLSRLLISVAMCSLIFDFLILIDDLTGSILRICHNMRLDGNIWFTIVFIATLFLTRNS